MKCGTLQASASYLFSALALKDYNQILFCWECCWISVATKEELINKSFFFICLETLTQFWQPPLRSFLHINGQLTQVIIKIIINIFNIISVMLLRWRKQGGTWLDNEWCWPLIHSIWQLTQTCWLTRYYSFTQ